MFAVMAKSIHKARDTVAMPSGETGAGKDVRRSKVKFGSVIVSGTKPSADLVEANVKRSTEALERVTKKLVKPGISLRAKKGVPRFFIDETEAGVIMRRLDGRTERGRLVNGIFEVMD